MDLKRIGFISVIVLLVQFLLGVATSLWVTIGTNMPWSHIGNVALFAVHAVLGAAIGLLTLMVIGRAFEVGPRPTRVWAVLSLLGVLAALGCGVGFVSSGGTPGYSFGMAFGWVLALFANVGIALGW